MSVKNELRKKYKSLRSEIADKSDKDEKICELLNECKYLHNADKILFYAALEDEADIDNSINYYLSLGKKIALPVCIDNDGKMQYYYIKSLNDAKSGKFGVREPDTNACSVVDDTENAVCVVPGIAFDKSGYRLGYGKGYYDRYLQNKNIMKMGITYDELLTCDVESDEFDVPVNFIVTQSGVYCVPLRRAK